MQAENILSSEKQTILIVDDCPENIKIINQILRDEYLITVATSGESALSHINSRLNIEPINTSEVKVASKADIVDNLSNSLSNTDQHLPDIILLDIMMPSMNGYEVCRQLKNNPKTSDIPIIFVTSKDAIEDEEKGFRLGAVDYITKPVSPSIVKARVKNHLLIKKQHDCLRNSISILHHKAEILQHKAELGMLAAGLAHDINNILFVAMMIENITYLIPDDLKEKSIIEEYIKRAFESLEMGREICHGFTNYLKDIGEEEMIHSFPPLLKPLDMFQRTFKVKLIKEIPSNLPYIKCKGSQIKRLVLNIFMNACQAVEANKKNGRIVIRAWSENERLFFSVNDNGPGIPANVLPHIFKEHYTTRKDGNGLGLGMVQKIINSHDGTIDCSTVIGEGTTFTISLPAI
ncbi:MAG: response regulator [Desulfamplus sp.]|nr:response regulator [Desulfamplus sp.]